MRRDERGSALVMVLFLILILTILGMAVLGAAIGGAQRTETRESDVQSLHLAEKSLEGAIASITAQLSGKVDNNQKGLDAAIQSYLDGIRPEDFVTGTALEAANGKITDISYAREGGVNDFVQYILTIKAEAEVNGVVRRLQQQVIIDTYPDFLKYALGTEGDLEMNGSPLIEGNLYAGNKLWVSDTAQYNYNGPSSTKSQFPKLKGEAHIQSLSDWLYSRNDSIYQRVDESGDSAQISNLVQDIMGISMDKVKIKSQREFVEVNVRESFVDKVAEAVGDSLDRATIASKLNSGELGKHLGDRYPSTFVFLEADQFIKPDKPAEPMDDSPEELERYEQEMAEYDFKMEEYRRHVKELTLPLKSTVYNGDLTLDGIEFTGVEYSEGVKNSKDPSHWFIVDGDLTIDNLGGVPISIRANMLVTGHVLIRGDANFDATIFSLGTKGAEPEPGYSTVLQDASVGGLGGKELVMISAGAILINRVDAFQLTPKVLKAFFYTDEDAELYGVGSAFSLYGGFFAKKTLTINAVVGEVAGSTGGLSFNPSGNNSKPRFQVEYNPAVFDNQKIGLPRVNQINVRVGKLSIE